MADLKFLCPECQQKIAVDESAVGAKIDCPTCRSTLEIPVSPEVPAKVEVRRRLAALAGQHTDLYKALEERQKLNQALEQELNALRDTVSRSEGEQARLKDMLNTAMKAQEMAKTQMTAHNAAKISAKITGDALAALRAELKELQAKRDGAIRRAEAAEARLAELEGKKRTTSIPLGDPKKAVSFASIPDPFTMKPKAAPAAAEGAEEVEKLRAERDELKTRLAALEEELKSLRSETDGHHVQSFELLALQKELTMARQGLEERDRLQEELVRIHEAQASLQARAAVADEELVRVREHLATLGQAAGESPVEAAAKSAPAPIPVAAPKPVAPAPSSAEAPAAPKFVPPPKATPAAVPVAVKPAMPGVSPLPKPSATGTAKLPPPSGAPVAPRPLTPAGALPKPALAGAKPLTPPTAVPKPGVPVAKPVPTTVPKAVAPGAVPVPKAVPPSGATPSVPAAPTAPSAPAAPSAPKFPGLSKPSLPPQSA